MAVSLLVLLLFAPAAHAGSWLLPVDGMVLRSFTIGRDPYARGLHRGVDLAAAPRSPVRSACAGHVTFSGRVPGGGRTVSVRCGAFLATYQQLGTIVVRAGQDLRAGAAMGSAGRSGDPRTRRPHVHLGVRHAATGRYVDPLAMLSGLRRAPPMLPPAMGPAPRPPAPLAPAPVPVTPVALGRAPVPGRAPALPRAVVSDGREAAPGMPRITLPASPAPTIPWVVWAGLGSVGLALPVGGLLTVRRRRRAPRHVAAVVR